METKIGLIGLGVLGSAMAPNIINNGFEVFGYDTSPSALEELERFGVQPTQSPSHAATLSDVLITCLPTVDALLDGESETNSNAFEAVEELSENTDTNRDSVGDQGKGSDQNSEDFQPFEVPPVESIDENADRANRLGALIATLLLFAFAIFWKKRKRSDP